MASLESITPLGLPVVPPVIIMAAVAWGSVAGSGLPFLAGAVLPLIFFLYMALAIQP